MTTQQIARYYTRPRETALLWRGGVFVNALHKVGGLLCFEIDGYPLSDLGLLVPLAQDWHLWRSHALRCVASGTSS